MFCLAVGPRLCATEFPSLRHTVGQAGVGRNALRVTCEYASGDCLSLRGSNSYRLRCPNRDVCREG